MGSQPRRRDIDGMISQAEQREGEADANVIIAGGDEDENDIIWNFAIGANMNAKSYNVRRRLFPKEVIGGVSKIML